ncbi:MAG: hypothetical protein OXC95_05135 [Dehalococcoidia bacterium]|nr:hypothetical protein [Dehalococcoidia bacterium]
MNIGILGAVSYEGIIEQEMSRTDVKTRFGDVSVLEGTVGDATVYYIRRFGQDNDMRSDIVNHAAHALAFRQLGIRRVITLNGFGGVNRGFAGLSWLSDVAGVEHARDWVMIMLEELAPIMRRAIGDLDAPTDCHCQQTWAPNDDSLPEWYRAIW